MQVRAAFVVTLLAAPAHGQAGDFVSARLDWQRGPGAETCASSEALRRAVAERLGRDPFVTAGADVIVKGRVAPEARGQGFVVDLELLSERRVRIGTRQLSTPADDCAALDESLPLVLALMLDIPRQELARAEAAAAPPPSREPVVRPTPIRVPPAAPREPWRFQAAGVVNGALGLLPEPGIGLGVTLGVEPPTFWLTEVDATLWLPSKAEGADGGTRFSLLTAGLYLCPISLAPGSLQVDACFGQRVGRLEAEGFDFSVNRRQVRLTYALGVRGRAWLALAGPIRLGVGLGAEAPLARDEFFYRRQSGERPELFRMAPVVGTAEAVLGVSLP